MPAYKVLRGVYVVGGAQLSHPLDSNVYMIYMGGQALVVDSGTGIAWQEILRNIAEIGVDPRMIRRIAITHCHIPNAGGSEYLRLATGGMVAAHEPDATAIRRGDPDATLASEYHVEFKPAVVSLSLRRREIEEEVGRLTIRYVHTPGHTPGSMSIYVSLVDGVKALFVGDLFGPLSRQWGSDEDSWRKSLETALNMDFDVICSSSRCVEKEWGKNFIIQALEKGAIWV